MFQTMKWWSCIISITLLWVHSGQGANVLIIPLPLPMRSQFNLGVQAGNALRAGGHQVWLMGGPETEESAKNKGFHYLAYDNSDLFAMEEKVGLAMSADVVGTGTDNRPGIIGVAKMMCSVNHNVCMKALGNDILAKKIRDQHFDLAIIGTTIEFGCMYMIPYKFDIPYVTFQPADIPWEFGVTAMPSFTPILLAPFPLSDKMTFMERVINTLAFILTPIGTDYMQSGDYQSVLAPEKPPKSLSQLRRDSMMTFIITDNTCLEYPRLSSPNYRIIGALTPAPAKPLTGELKAFCDGATDGLILITSGSTNAWGMLMKSIVPMIREVGPKFKQRILFQYVGNEVPTDLPANVRFEPWTPQNDVLGHKNIRAFVSHGGANGQYEATYHGVPIVCLGFMQEQEYSCRRVVEHHLGVWLPILEATTSRLLSVLTEVINNPSYRQNMTRCSQIMRSIPHASQELLFWVNHVLQFGAAHLRPSSVDMPFYQLFMLDIIAFITVCLFVFFFILFNIVKCICRCLRRYCKRKKE